MQREQENNKNDKKIIKSEPGSPGSKNEIVNDKKISQGEKEIIQKGLALAIINNLKT